MHKMLLVLKNASIRVVKIFILLPLFACAEILCLLISYFFLGINEDISSKILKFVEEKFPNIDYYFTRNEW